MTVRQLAELVHGQVHGDGEQLVSAARPLSEAGPGDVTFVENEKHAHLLTACTATAVVVPASLPTNGRTLIRVTDPLGAFITIVQRLHGLPPPPPPSIDPRAAIHPTAKVGPDASIHPFAVVGENTVIGSRCQIHSGAVVGRGCRIGDNVVLHPNVVVYDGVHLGNRVTIHANSVIGADGFGYRVQKGRHVKVPQLGGVEIGDDVELGACVTIDRGTFQATRIGEGTKIDNLVQIAHNCKIGRHNLFASQSGIAGSSSTGDYVVLAGQVGVRDHVHLGTGAVVGAKSGVARDVPDGDRVLGIPAIPERDQKRTMVLLEKLPEMRRQLRRVLDQLGIGDEE